MLKLVNKPGSKKDIEDFKKGAEISPTLDDEQPETKKITQWIRHDNWAWLKQTSAMLSSAGAKVTINMLLDEAVDGLRRKMGSDGVKE